MSTQEVVQLAESLVGKIPYNLYSFDPSETGFHCLGLVHWCRAQSGLYTPTDWGEAASVGFEVPRHEMRPGDMIVLANTPGWVKKYHLPYHHMMVVEKGIIHTGRAKGIEIVDRPYHDNWIVRRFES